MYISDDGDCYQIVDTIYDAPLCKINRVVDIKSNLTYGLKLYNCRNFNLFFKEALVLNSVFHPNIIKLHKIITTGDKYGLLLELGDENLLDHIKRHELLCCEKQEIFKQIRNAIKYLHYQGVNHGDLSLENILMINGVPKLCDFGSSVFINIKPAVIKPPKYNYQPFELKQLIYDPEKVDVWGLGVIGFTLFTNEYPYENNKHIDSDPDVFQKYIFERLSQSASNIPKETFKMILSGLIVDADKRPSLKKKEPSHYKTIYFKDNIEIDERSPPVVSLYSLYLMTREAIDINHTNIDTIECLFRSLFNIDDTDRFSQHKTHLLSTLFYIFTAFKQDPDKWKINNNIMNSKHQNYDLIIKMIKLNVHKYLNDLQMSWMCRYFYDKTLVTPCQMDILSNRLQKWEDAKIDY